VRTDNIFSGDNVEKVDNFFSPPYLPSDSDLDPIAPRDPIANAPVEARMTFGSMCDRICARISQAA